MNLAQALRFAPPPSMHDTSRLPFGIGENSKTLALVGSGGKTTALFQLARSLTATTGQPIIVTATTHLHVDQIRLADSHWIANKLEDLFPLKDNLRGVMLVTGPLDGDRLSGLDKLSIGWLHEVCGNHSLPLLIEADGARQKPLKAPAEHEPVIPDFVDTVVIVAGMSGLGKPLTDEYVHRPEIFARLSGLKHEKTVSSDALARVLTHPAGGLKGIPPGARRVVLLNQADTPELQAQAQSMFGELLSKFDSGVVASLQHSKIHAIYEPAAAIILAAGEAKRYGQPKQMLDWHGKPLVRQVAESALTAGLSPVVVVTGSHAETVSSAIRDLPLTIRHNPDWQTGQSSSLQAGLRALPPGTGSVLFLLADQPQITPAVLRALVERHSLDLSPIVAPQVQGQRANPVLFDQVTFPALMSLSGDVGGRAIFSKFPVTYLAWHDENLLADIDTPEDYRKLIHGI